MPLTLKQLVRLTDVQRRNYAEGVGVVGFKVRENKHGKPMVMAKTRTQIDPVTGNPRPKHATGQYLSAIEFYGKYVVVSCSCDDFMYRFEYALHKAGAARLEYSNGAPPNVTNPAQKPMLCKHLYCLAKYLERTGALNGIK